MSPAQSLQVILALLFIVGLLLAMAWVARRSGWIRQHVNRTDLKVLGTLRLGARTSIALVQVRDAHLVVGVTAQQITLLHTLPAGPSGTQAAPADFTESLNKAVARL
ncbi:MAG: flagellar biosynthetic protein FliO [Castellaniella sp.]|uniref:flagellar biosynthetic protein FliO n=1 Tax=Castellaniella sp. TaxID=1955812 RepID=UPI0012160969|nr:flagellar biosynthetic protein FliO [Castellaniella sp.]TAN27724.1 MAG: flagellar biosynthetic protein FliO [Castellaniella sp.]